MASRKAKSEARAVARGKDGEAGPREGTGKYYTRCYFNVRSTADISQLNLNLLRFLLQEAKGELLRISRGSSTSTGSSSVQCIDQD